MSEYSAPVFGFPGTVRSRKMTAERSAVCSGESESRTISAKFFVFDGEYLRRLAAGDAETETHFVEYFSILLRAKLRMRLRSAQDVEDLRQEVFLRVLQQLRNGPGVHNPGKLGAFVHAVCNNVVFEHFRSKSRTTQLDDTGPEPCGDHGDFDRDILSREVRDRVQVVLNALSAKDRGLLRAVFLEERDKDTVCRDYGVQRNYLRVLLHRARRRLRDLLVQPKSGGGPALTWSGAQQ